MRGDRLCFKKKTSHPANERLALYYVFVFAVTAVDGEHPGQAKRRGNQPVVGECAHNQNGGTDIQTERR